jgi:hypothetical protein
MKRITNHILIFLAKVVKKLNPLRVNMQKTLHKLKSKISPLLSNNTDNFITPITIEVDQDLYRFIQHKAKAQQTTEESIALQAVQHYFERRSLRFKPQISQQKKDENPLFLLDGFTKTLK